MKQLEVQIMGNSYLLGCPEGGETRLREAVALVDAAMCKIRDTGKVRARERIAVLAALNLAFDLSEQQPAVATPPPPITSSTSSPIASTSVTSPQAVPLPSNHRTPLTHTGSETHADDAQLHSLLLRLDTALGTDGRLL